MEPTELVIALVSVVSLWLRLEQRLGRVEASLMHLKKRVRSLRKPALKPHA